MSLSGGMSVEEAEDAEVGWFLLLRVSLSSPCRFLFCPVVSVLLRPRKSS